ncbi:uncharacterized protein L3040_005385 [Drepanopeziza brunnea f. sp. 'multigermtubi']|uniref:DNA excision repair protein n=1 Tax=Marssonina brunnea f. sp. multigermtubi (strain MB_m1) TaxID=1072389 RepID=K1X8Y2_MARBU|nr:DNA excision repair protein [Drepanopeziza brunnea f. sp. 'multigermtubi' MB_m1]EKD17163.1 DNA excision repair protein [Drepanopeziza brunnea f. sp. 'multigermtubi' MB_m1]KAJ5041819.1 hypothetical protein L3040_005385 [Drepanopeziza brunnea f. sp. 'multigermtubi']
MGVTSLWPLLAPSARPTPLPTLNRKRLAVDASIWIYQFLKAVRDKEGNALRNSHVIGFFRRICKLLYFGIKPVFVFDGGAPVLKRQTVLRRRQRREGKVVDAARTAGKMLAVQMKRRGEEEEERRKRNAGKGKGREVREDDEEAIPDDAELVYVGEMGMSSAERNKNRTFRKSDAYHLPELANGIEGMGQPNDPRIMSTEELEDYARQFHNGEDVNLYDFSKIDFNGDFFMSLPAGDRYNILNAARLRSRMRMGYGQEQLDQMYPNKMDFSRFQIARVMERNELTQRLMNLNGMNDALPGVGGGAGGGRIAGERGREYVLVKNEGVEGGYVLGVVGGEKGAGERNKPIDVDAVPVQLKDDSEEEEEFEDVPVEGLNRLPNVSPSKRLNMSYRDFQDREIAEQRKRIGGRTGEESSAQRGSSEEIPLSQLNRNRLPSEDPDSLFVSQYPAAESSRHDELFDEDEDDDINRAIALSLQQPDDADLENSTDEDEHLERAIAMSLRKQHGKESEEDETDDVFEDVPMPAYEQRAVEATKPISKASGGMIAHMVNNRANAAVVRPTEKEKEKVLEETSDSDSEMDMQAALAKARRQKAPDRRTQPAPVATNQKNPFDGPLPFESLGSIFKRKPMAQSTDKPVEGDEEEKDMEGGFEREPVEEEREPIPWMAAGDIRDQVEVQRKRDQQLNAEDREMLDEEERDWRRRNAPIVIESEDEGGSGSDVEIVDRPVSLKGLGSIAGDLRPASHAAQLFEDGQPLVESAGEAAETETLGEVAENTRANPPVSSIPSDRQSTEVSTEKQPEAPEDEEVEWSESDYGDVATLKRVVDPKQSAGERADAPTSKCPSPESEDVAMAQPVSEVGNEAPVARAPSPILEDAEMSDPASAFYTNNPASLSGMELAAEERTSIDAEFAVEASTSIAQPATELTAQEQASIGAEFDALSSDDEELMASLALEAETHAQFASTLNNRTDAENQASYERELKALRNQQKKDRRDADEVTTVMISECQALLRLFGLPYITAPMEAEAQCAELVNLGLVDGVVTDDCDIFLFGGTRVYKNMFNSNKYVECYLASDIEKELSLSRDQLIAIAHLLGSDYTEGLPGVGPVTAIEILSEFPSKDGLEEFKEWFTSIQRPHAPPLNTESSTFRKKFRRQQATKLFLPTGFPSKAVTEAYWKPEVDKTPEAFQWGVPDLEKLRDFLMATIGWSQERTDEVLVPVIRDMNRREQEGTQSNITRFFDGAVGAGVRGGGANGNGNGGKGSKRMMDAVGRLKARKRAKKDSNPLAKTYAEVGIEWAKKNDIGWTEREQAKLWGKGGAGSRAKGKAASARGRKRVVEQEDDDDEEEGGEEEEEEEGEEEMVKADNEIDEEDMGGEDGDDDDDTRTGNGNGVRNGNGKGQQGKGKSKIRGKNDQGRAKQTSRKRAKV